jgi:transcriptional regulator with XRE-family HTH domain
VTQPGAVSELADDLDELRRLAGLTYRDLARRTGCPRSTLNDALTGRRFPRLDTVVAIVRACAGDEAWWRARWVAAGRLRSDRAAAPISMRSERALEKLLHLLLLGIPPDQIARALSVWVDITVSPGDNIRQTDGLAGASLSSPGAHIRQSS